MDAKSANLRLQDGFKVVFRSFVSLYRIQTLDCKMASKLFFDRLLAYIVYKP